MDDMDDSLELFDWIPASLAAVLEDILADAPAHIPPAAALADAAPEPV